jgi:hypothetical protein
LLVSFSADGVSTMPDGKRRDETELKKEREKGIEKSE